MPRTRVHLDRVDGLGDFAEPEVVLTDDEAAERGAEQADRLLAALGIAPSQRVSSAYVDLLRERGTG
jgi:adenylate cyclase class IV